MTEQLNDFECLRSGDITARVFSHISDTGNFGRQEPYDAFFGARYAVVRDPGGNDVGLMSPIDQHRRFTPKS